MRWSIVIGGLVALAAAAAVVVFAVKPSAVGATPSARDRELGKELFDRQCASCHGAGGRGDGSSAAGFATKPADLTDGRLLNPLPDEFLVNVIRRGGPAEGLAPTMPAFAKFLSDAQTAQVVAYVRSLAQPPLRAAPPTLVQVPGAPRQPIFFSHVIHAGSFGIDCQYCHADARRSEYAGLPSVSRCLGCHTIIGAQDNPEIRKIHDYASRREAIPWVRVFKVPEFSYFPHKPHVRAGVACQRCHGPIGRMRVVGAETGQQLGNDLKRLIGLRPPPPPLTMGWCVDCHRAENAKGAKAPLDCVTCHH
ncbi:MAG TPA: c-type cytochrome [Methylomirabilota bacterium]|nr:c-type cytochrome [Methylomirabilota bacterium]